MVSWLTLSNFTLAAILTRTLDVAVSTTGTGDLLNTNGIIQHSLPDSLRYTFNTLRNLDTKPSCHKVAAAALIHSCSTLESTLGETIPRDNGEISQGADSIISGEINLYAARLAVCELSSAKAFVPAACEAFIPTVKTIKKPTWAGYLTGKGASKPRKLHPEYDDITEQHLAQCLTGLESRPQSWTSFSNSKQNAVVMCHAMRGEIERDQQVHLHNVLANTTADVVSALMQSKQDWEDFKTGFSELSTNMRRTHLDLVQDDEQRLQAARVMWDQWQAELQTGLQDIASSVQQMRSDLHQARNDLQDNSQHVQNTLLQTKEQITDLTVRHLQDLRDALDSVVALDEVIDYISQRMHEAISKAAYNVTQSLDTANALISNLSAGLTNITGRMDGLNDAADTVEKLNSGLEALLTGNWAGLHGLLEKAKVFGAYAVLCALLSVGFWHMIMGVIGSGCAAIATGLASAYVFTFLCDPIDAARSAAGHLHSALQSVAFVGIAASTIAVIYIVYGWIVRRRAARQSQALVAYTGDVQTFRLPVNDPRFFNKRAGLKTWSV